MVSFTLPEDRNWVRIVDTQPWFDVPTNGSEPEGILSTDPTIDPYRSWNIELQEPEEVGSSYDAQPFTIVILEQQ